MPDVSDRQTTIKEIEDLIKLCPLYDEHEEAEELMDLLWE